jgi:hypothetical protein
MMTVFFALTLVALVLANGSLLVILLVRLAEEHREIGDMRRLQEAQRRTGHYPPTR